MMAMAEDGVKFVVVLAQLVKAHQGDDNTSLPRARYHKIKIYRFLFPSSPSHAADCH